MIAAVSGGSHVDRLTDVAVVTRENLSAEPDERVSRGRRPDPTQMADTTDDHEPARTPAPDAIKQPVRPKLLDVLGAGFDHRRVR